MKNLLIWIAFWSMDSFSFANNKEDYQQDYSKLQKLFEKYYPHSEKSGYVDWSNYWEANKSFAINSADRSDFLSRLQKITGRFRDWHVAIYSGEKGFSCLPIQIKRVGNDPIVVGPKNAARFGQQIVGVDGIDIQQLIDQQSQHHKGSTYSAEVYEHTQWLGCRKKSILGASESDSIAVTFADGTTDTFSRSESDNDPTPKLQELLIPPAKSTQVSKVPNAFIVGKDGYLNISAFIKWPIESWPPSSEAIKSYALPYQTALEKLKSSDQVVLDLRDNGGGPHYYYCPIMKMLGLDMKKCGDTHAVDYPVIYTGKLKVLVNEGCYSGCEAFSAHMQDNGRATIIGTTTAGAGGYATIPLYI